jgi:Ca-activated chloride channel homolog
VSGSDLRLLQPLWLALWLLLPLLWLLPHRGRNTRHTVMRTLLGALIVLALARPVMFVSNERTHHVFVIDRSESVSPARQARAASALATLRTSLRKTDPVSVITVGASEDATLSVVGASASSLGSALALAAAQIPDRSRGVVTLFSDGLATDQGWARAITTLRARGIPVHTVDVAAEETSDPYPATLRVGQGVRVGQTVRAVVDVVGTGSEISVRLMGPDGELARAGPMRSEGRLAVPLEFEAPHAGFLDVTVRLDAAGDADSTNNTLRRVLAIQDPLRLLYVGARQRGGAERLAKLLGRGFDVVDAGSGNPDERFPLDGYDLVVVDDRPAETLSAAFQQRLVEAVRAQGVGLLFAGGKASFGTGGYHDTRLAEALPVRIEQREEKRDPSVSLAIIIDTSGSMAGQPLELAKQIAQLTIRRLTPDDQVGIVEFYGAKQWAVPLQSAANRLEIDRAIGRMQAGGGTVLYPGIEEAYYGLKNMRTRHKHILVITDAGVEDADFEGMVRRVARDGINLSSVLVGDGRYDDVMFNLASWGKGRYYAVADRFSLVELILKQMSTTQLPSYRTGQFPLLSRGGQGWWGNVDRSELPPLDAYVELEARPQAEVIIEETGRSKPVLASWQYGLGRVTALMTEPLGDGTRSWRQWADYGAMLGRLISRTASDDEPVRYELDRYDGELRILAHRQTRDSAVMPLLRLEDGTPIPLVERAPGVFRALLPVDVEEDVRIVAELQGASRSLSRRLVSLASEAIAPEKQVDPATGLDLARLAELTGGKTLDARATTLPPLGPALASLGVVTLWPWALALALLAYLAEIAWRRRTSP